MKNSREFLLKRETANDYNERLIVFTDIYTEYRKRMGKPLRILDIGCGKSVEMIRSKTEGDYYCGCDFFENVNVSLDQYVTLDFNEEKLSEKLPNTTFDVIYCGEVIEHLFSPDDLLDELKKLMHDESILILSTPNLGYYVNRILLLFGIAPLFLENSSRRKMGRVFQFLGEGNETEGHIKVFTYGALKELVDSCGFTTLRVVPVSIWGFWLDRVVQAFSKSLAADNVFVLKKKPD
jgi:SAM-dependent methyltransferase